MESQKPTWTVIEANAHIADVYLILKKNCRPVTPVSSEEFDQELSMLNAKMSSSVTDSFMDILDPFFEVHWLNEAYVHHYLAVIFDPELTDLKSTLMRLHLGNPQKARSIAKIYDEDLIIPLLLSICSIKKQ